MSSQDMFLVFSPMIALSIGYAIMFGAYSYARYKRYL